MRRLLMIGLISILPLSVILADDSSYHEVHYGSASQPAEGLMEYYDGGGMARNMLGPSLLTDSGSQEVGGMIGRQGPLDYSTPQDSSWRANSSDDSLMSPSHPTVLSAQDHYQPSVQP
jgi:hypothetical protein